MTGGPLEGGGTHSLWPAAAALAWLRSEGEMRLRWLVDRPTWSERFFDSFEERGLSADCLCGGQAWGGEEV